MLYLYCFIVSFSLVHLIQVQLSSNMILPRFVSCDHHLLIIIRHLRRLDKVRSIHHGRYPQLSTLHPHL